MRINRLRQGNRSLTVAALCIAVFTKTSWPSACLKKVGTTMLDPLSGQLEQYMTLLSVRQKLVASNIANADTPDYRTKDIDFESEFRQSLAKAAGPKSDPEVADVTGLRVKADGNNVDLDRESRLLSEDAIRFSVASNLLRGQIKTLRLAITGGGTNS